jgi:hypothetical protein
MHHTTPRFWDCYNKLPESVRATADKNYELLKADPEHASLHFKKVGKYWSVRVGVSYRALGVEDDEGIVWFWIGTHAEYDRLIATA